MFIFLWILGSMGVAYAAKVTARQPFWWFMLSIVCTPLATGIALWAMNRWGIRFIRPT
ncbi:MAG: hypothetical protein ACREFW_03620 [Rhizomicrobium sp.]